MGNQISSVGGKTGDPPRTSYTAAMASVTRIEKRELMMLREKWLSSMRLSGHPTSVTRDEFGKGIEESAIADTDVEILDRLFVMFDKMGDGLVNVREVISSLAALSSGSDFQKLCLALELYDVHKTQKIRAPELLFVLDAINNLAYWFGDPALSPEDLHSVVDDVFRSISPPSTEDYHAPFDDVIQTVLNHHLVSNFLQADASAIDAEGHSVIGSTTKNTDLKQSAVNVSAFSGAPVSAFSGSGGNLVVDDDASSITAATSTPAA